MAQSQSLEAIMGRLVVAGTDYARQVASGALTSVSAGAQFAPTGVFNISVWGTFVGTAVIQRSFDGGTTWISLTDVAGTANAYTAPFSLMADEPEIGVAYRINCTAYTSGTINWRFSQ
jgi:hypothetical protein